MLGGDLKRKEMLSGRFADVLSHMYLASSAIKVYRDNGSHQREGYLLDWACQYSLFQAQQALDGILRNFPNKWLGFSLRLVVFPSGRYLRMPSDALNQEVAELIQTNCPARDRLTKEVYIPKNQAEIVCQIERAFTLCEKTRDLRRRLRKEGHRPDFSESYADWLIRLQAESVINANEASALDETRNMVSAVIQVDSFDPA